MVGNHKHGFAAKPQTPAFHGCGDHFKGFSAAYLVCQQRISTIQNMGDGIPLVFPQCDFRAHSAKIDMRTIVFSGTVRIVTLIVELNQGLPPLRVFPNPLPECVFNGLLLLLCQGCFLLVQYPTFILVLIYHCVVDPDITQV